MEHIGIVAYREKLDQVVDKYSDLLGDEATSLDQTHSIPSAKKLQAELAEIEDDERLLRIGIVGRVKSGKSSLLNALVFEGQSILPKAATPMTAALTTLSHGDSVQAEVEFFTPADIEDMKAQARDYEKQVQERVRDLLDELLEKGESRLGKAVRKVAGHTTEDKEKAQRRATREIRDKNPVLASSYEQCEKIDNSNTSIGSLGKSKVLNLSGGLADLQSQLAEYVGADGPYMPFTKSVNILLPQDNLKDIQIVDTPGINDPIQSREARTREYLSKCDVVLVVSPAGQFISHEDMELMDRITSKEGVRELYVVAAQVDTQMFSNMKVENDGQLDRVLNAITQELGHHLKKVIEDLKESNPEVKDAYDQLIEGQSRVIHSAGLCESMKQRFGQQEGWDEGMVHVWSSLQREYPDYFSNEQSAKSNLDKLANMSTIQAIVEQVRAKKEEILKNRIGNYVQGKHRSLRALRTGLSDHVEEMQNNIEREDVQTIKKKREALKTNLSNASEDVSLGYQESIQKVISELKKEALRKLSKEALEEALDKATGIGKGRVEIEKPWWKFWGSPEYKQVEYKTIRTGTFLSGLSEFHQNLTDSLGELAEQKKEEWRSDVLKSATKELRESFDEDQLDAAMIRRVARRTVNAITISEFSYSKELPKSLRSQGLLKEKAAEKFINEANVYIGEFVDELRGEINKYVKSLEEEMSKYSLAEQLLERYQRELVSLENSVKNKEMELKRISAVKGELDNMEVNP